jgi:hypothetical protein
LIELGGKVAKTILSLIGERLLQTRQNGVARLASTEVADIGEAGQQLAGSNSSEFSLTMRTGADNPKSRCWMIFTAVGKSSAAGEAAL